MIALANAVRDSFVKRTIPLTMSTRCLISWAEMTYDFRGAVHDGHNPIAYALDRAFLYRCDSRPDVRAAIVKLVQGLFGDEFGDYK